MGKHVRITIRQDGVLVLRGRASSRAWCPCCRAEGEMIVIDRSAVLPGTASSGIEGWLDSLELHRLEAADGSRRICLKSLMGCIANKRSS